MALRQFTDRDGEIWNAWNVAANASSGGSATAKAGFASSAWMAADAAVFHFESFPRLGNLFPMTGWT